MLPAIGRRGHTTSVAAFSALFLAMVAVGPVLGDKELGHKNPVGFHALRDSSSRAGATCRYNGVYPTPGGYSYEGKLKYLDVRPPKVRAIASPHEVGWRFSVERRAIHIDPVVFDPWIETYKSSIQRRMTDNSTNAPFSMRSINVNVPSSGADDDPNYEYRVKIKMFWFSTSGDVAGTATHLVEWYRSVYKNWPIGDPPNDTRERPCTGWSGWDIN